VKRAVIYGAAGAIFLLLAVAAGSLWWLLATPQGAQRILAVAAGAAGGRLSVRQLRGSLLHGLELHGITFDSPQLDAKIGQILLDPRPELLLSGNLVADRLQVKDTAIKDRRPEKKTPAELAWPILPAWTTRLNGWIGSLTIENFSYQRLAGAPILVDRLSARLDWRNGRAGLSNLDVAAAAGRLAGNGSLSFREPRLVLALTAVPSKPVGGFSTFLFKADLKPAGGDEQSAGAVRIGALSSRKRWLELSTVIGISRSSLQFRTMVVTEPGRNGRLSGAGSFSFAAEQPAVSLALKPENLDLSAEIPSLPPVSGTFNLAGALENYTGDFSLATAAKDWRAARLAGSFSGNSAGADLTISRGAVIRGTLSGALRARWKTGLSLSTALHGRNLNPARITPDWDGAVNFELSAKLESAAGNPTAATIEAYFPQSRLRGRKLTGHLSAAILDRNVTIRKAFLQGRGFDIRASGELARAIGFSAAVTDLAGIVPGAGGALRAQGEVRQRNRQTGLAASGQGENLRVGTVSAQSASFTISLEAAADRKISARATSRGVRVGNFQAENVQFDASGTLARHVIGLAVRSPDASLQAQVEGSYNSAAWQARLHRLAGRDRIGPWSLQQPADIRISAAGVSSSPVILNGNPEERLEIRGAANRRFTSGSVEAGWRNLNLARIGQWLSGVRITGSSSGRLSLSAPQKGAKSVSLSTDLSATFSSDAYQAEVRSGRLTMETRGRNLEGFLALDMARQGHLRARVSAQTPADGFIPRGGSLEANLEGLDLKLLKPWLPPGLALEGILTARTAGQWGNGAAIRLAGQTSVAGGLVRQLRKGGELTATLRTAELSWNWSGNALTGTTSFELSDTGRLKGSFMLPLPARLPLAMDPNGQVDVAVSGKMRENGLLTALFPGMVQESSGELDVDLRVGDTWRNPAFSGLMLFSRAAMYLPRAGIRLTDLQASASLERGGIRISSFSAKSGAGTINGSGFIGMTDWKPGGYQAAIRGDRFQLVNLPELQVVGSPELDIEGAGKKITVRGELAIPELLVAGIQTQGQVKPSSDVIVIDAPPKEARPFPLDLDMQVRVLFGKKVLVKMEGIDARLAGSVDLIVRGPDDIRGKGEIRVAEGSYRAYGVNLNISKGRVVYTGGAVGNPNLDILALRTVDEVKAGVLIGGNLKRPAIRLYSEPAMSDGDVMGYIVLGHPLSDDKAQIGDVVQAAGLLLSAGQSAILQDQIGRRFGLDTIGVETDKTDASRSIITVGKYLTPKLFISYGRSLFSPTTYLRARYNFSKHWELETWTGSESGADLYYKINFN
jgi:translocation and assembly module TamB